MWDEQFHHVLVLEVLPNSVRSDHHKLVAAFDVVLDQLRLSVSARFYTCLVAERTGHCQSWHHHILHPDPRRTKLFALLICLREDSSPKLQNSLTLVRTFRLLVHGEGKDVPFELFWKFYVAQQGKGCRIRSRLLKSCISILSEEDGPRISYIKGQKPLIVNKDCDEGGSCKFGIDIRVKQLLIGGTECEVDNLDQLLSFWGVVYRPPARRTFG